MVYECMHICVGTLIRARKPKAIGESSRQSYAILYIGKLYPSVASVRVPTLRLFVTSFTSVVG